MTDAVFGARPKTKKAIIKIVQQFIAEIEDAVLIFDIELIKSKVTELKWFLEEEQ